MNTINVLVFPVGQPSYEKEIPSGLNAMQELVGGYIEMPTLLHMPGGYSLDVCCNEEGKLDGLPMNRKFRQDVLCGQFFVCRADKKGYTVSLTAEDVAAARKFFGE